MKTKVGLLGIGLDTYCSQLEGLLDNLNAYQEQIKNKLADLASKWPMPEW